MIWLGSQHSPGPGAELPVGDASPGCTPNSHDFGDVSPTGPFQKEHALISVQLPQEFLQRLVAITIAGLPDPTELALRTNLRLPPDGTRPVFSRAPSD
ncbi:hypothetical protein [Saccharopolyspora spinosa]|uniref:Uncharacterized protein n=1 Tax=Saccharopolyspora spinosa TaxID=60894 RepID=A0A2N3Y741_SACSN|nr:hypothetical protein A8926_6864 [Saccharopolyspora spinosa]